MTSNAANADPLSFRVLTAKRPGLVRDLPPGKEDLAWVANAVTLVYGKRDAVLVDTFLTENQSRSLTDWVVASGKRLLAIYVTHGHADHFFGLASLLERFPKARAFAAPEVVEAMRASAAPEALDGFWRRLFPGQIPERIAIADPLGDDGLVLEGHALLTVDTGRTDTAHSTSLYAPSIGLVAAGDVVYSGIHPYLAETTSASRLEWIAALDRLEVLAPKAVVAGHKVPGNADDPADIGRTRQYLRDFNMLVEFTSTARELYDTMIDLHPDRANPGSLWAAAQAAKGQSQPKLATTL